MNTPVPSLDMALLIEALAADRADPLSRFVDSLSGDLRIHAEETIQLRQEFISNVQRVLQASNPHEAAGYASWITKHVHEVAYRWASLQKALARWIQYDVSPFKVVLPPVAAAPRGGDS